MTAGPVDGGKSRVALLRSGYRGGAAGRRDGLLSELDARSLSDRHPSAQRRRKQYGTSATSTNSVGLAVNCTGAGQGLVARDGRGGGGGGRRGGDSERRRRRRR